MKKYLACSILVAVVLSCAHASAAMVEAESKVVAATVYTTSVLITREVSVTLEKGFNEVIFTNVPEQLNENTLSVSAQGTARAKILDAKIKKIFLEEAQSERVRELEDRIESLGDEITSLAQDQQVLQKEREFLASINLHARDQIPEDLITKTPDAAGLESVRSFITQKWDDSFARELTLSKELRSANKKMQKLKRELNQLRQARRREKRIISVELEVETKGELQISAAYLSYQANWYPEYDARVDYENKLVEMVCLGVVKQTTGDDWSDIDLALSTAKPTISGRMPELNSWILRPYALRRERKAKKRANAPMLPRSQMAGALDEDLFSDFLYEAEEDKPAEKKAELAYAQAQESLTSVTYKIMRKADIASDGTKHRLPIFSDEFSAEFFYSATPKLSTYAYLVSKVTNERETLLPAAVRIFLGDAYVGSSSIDAVGEGEEFDLYLGIDEGVKVKREKTNEDTKEVWLAGIKRKNKVIATTYKITVENYKRDIIKVNIFDHAPVSQNDQIAVKLLEVKPKPSVQDYEDKKGLMLWELEVAPRGEQIITYTYQVDFPRHMNIGL